MFKFKVGVFYFTTSSEDAPTGELIYTIKAECEADAIKRGIRRLYRTPPADFYSLDLIAIQEKTDV